MIFVIFRISLKLSTSKIYIFEGIFKQEHDFHSLRTFWQLLELVYAYLILLRIEISHLSPKTKLSVLHETVFSVEVFRLRIENMTCQVVYS